MEHSPCLPQAAPTAFVLRADDGRVTLGFNAWVLERLRDEELLFVVGHELGHVAFEHDLIPPSVVGAVRESYTRAVAHVGDSRAYRLRDSRFELLTQDHTWVNEQVVAGFLTEEQARVHPLKNVVTRALGGDSEVEVDVREWPVQIGDLFLLCSDGLTTMLSDPEIFERLRAGARMEEICGRLVRDANARGGFDNISVLLLRIESDADPDSDEDTAAGVDIA